MPCSTDIQALLADTKIDLNQNTLDSIEAIKNAETAAELDIKLDAFNSSELQVLLAKIVQIIHTKNQESEPKVLTKLTIETSTTSSTMYVLPQVDELNFKGSVNLSLESSEEVNLTRLTFSENLILASNTKLRVKEALGGEKSRLKILDNAYLKAEILQASFLQNNWLTPEEVNGDNLAANLSSQLFADHFKMPYLRSRGITLQSGEDFSQEIEMIASVKSVDSFSSIKTITFTNAGKSNLSESDMSLLRKLKNTPELVFEGLSLPDDVARDQRFVLLKKFTSDMKKIANSIINGNQSLRFINRFIINGLENSDYEKNSTTFLLKRLLEDSPIGQFFDYKPWQQAHKIAQLKNMHEVFEEGVVTSTYGKPLFEDGKILANILYKKSSNNNSQVVMEEFHTEGVYLVGLEWIVRPNSPHFRYKWEESFHYDKNSESMKIRANKGILSFLAEELDINNERSSFRVQIEPAATKPRVSWFSVGEKQFKKALKEVQKLIIECDSHQELNHALAVFIRQRPFTPIIFKLNESCPAMTDLQQKYVDAFAANNQYVISLLAINQRYNLELYSPKVGFSTQREVPAANEARFFPDLSEEMLKIRKDFLENLENKGPNIKDYFYSLNLLAAYAIESVQSDLAEEENGPICSFLDAMVSENRRNVKLEKYKNPLMHDKYYDRSVLSKIFFNDSLGFFDDYFISTSIRKALLSQDVYLAFFALKQSIIVCLASVIKSFNIIFRDSPTFDDDKKQLNSIFDKTKEANDITKIQSVLIFLRKSAEYFTNPAFFSNKGRIFIGYQLSNLCRGASECANLFNKTQCARDLAITPKDLESYDYLRIALPSEIAPQASSEPVSIVTTNESSKQNTVDTPVPSSSSANELEVLRAELTKLQKEKKQDQERLKAQTNQIGQLSLLNKSLEAENANLKQENIRLTQDLAKQTQLAESNYSASAPAHNDAPPQYEAVFMGVSNVPTGDLLSLPIDEQNNLTPVMPPQNTVQINCDLIGLNVSRSSSVARKAENTNNLIDELNERNQHAENDLSEVMPNDKTRSISDAPRVPSTLPSASLTEVGHFSGANREGRQLGGAKQGEATVALFL